MNEMYEYAKQYKRQNKDVYITNVTSYSFQVITIPLKKDEQPKSWVVMKSYFLTF